VRHSDIHDTTVMTYAAYLRIYEPVAAFHEPDRSRWAVYAASSSRPRRRDSVAAEQAEALYRVITPPTSGCPIRTASTLRGLPRGFAGATWHPARAETELAEVGRWLEDFHPYSLVELDYGELVQLFSDDALSSDQSAPRSPRPSTGQSRASASSRSRCTRARTAGGAPSPDTRWRTEYQAGPADTFPGTISEYAAMRR
jgi:hypothetical protein